MTRPVTVTLDVEDLRASTEPEDRTVRMTEQVLDLFGRFEVRASVFVVGDVAERHPSLIRRIAREGHELGLHAHAHIPMTSVPPSGSTTPQRMPEPNYRTSLARRSPATGPP